MANVDVVNIIIDVERQDLEREELLLSAVDVRKEVASSNAGMSLLERSSSKVLHKEEVEWECDGPCVIVEIKVCVVRKKN